MRPSHRTRVLALAAGTSLLMAGCGSNAATPRQRLADYVSSVDSVELQLRKPLAEVTAAGSRFANLLSSSSLGSSKARAEQRKLLTAASRAQVLRQRLAGIQAPHAAAHLREQLLDLLDSQLALTREVAEMVVFIPGYSAALTGVEPTIHRLQSALLAGSAHADAEAARRIDGAHATALRRFARELEAILARVRTLQPPAVSRPGYRAQVGALVGMSRDARSLASALVHSEASRAQHALSQLELAARSDQSVRAQRAQIAAVRNYDHQVKHLEAVAGEIDDERSRLAGTLR